MFGLFKKTKGYQDLKAPEFERMATEKNTVILDVRTPGEFSSGHLPGAVHMNLLSVDFAARVSALNKAKVYMVYCRSGNRSAEACSFMAGNGLKVFNLEGGIARWTGKIV